MWECEIQTDGYTMWRGRDAEGREVWAPTRDREGVSVEPTGALIYYSRDEAARDTVLALL